MDLLRLFVSGFQQRLFHGCDRLLIGFDVPSYRFILVVAFLRIEDIVVEDIGVFCFTLRSRIDLRIRCIAHHVLNDGKTDVKDKSTT